ncbi:leucine-rich repeat and immunoglobulin-like domain-containing nogo receptor-interacting protein 4b [Paramormyrops kingsleyae]|uniref:Leucine rich repeat and Ig domain containing 4b n=1 Tax=Paramormyrops kingsleyae TaxID=1676925 RepID=A0A3B3SHH0_9TELE|nr:leucine-rich repeat and immunoglobulin-like domain-containing nogo receptor-interacting protein 1 [Paramormyrops kingsleyae]XP_023657225.1 leucine-rich repeat and immunoglobulin-like domain-containing nogo receptor-interacting protein 1 [Paramormyrops kingsleyae]XP_023657226.1 leucine-rich repeat and immunoglobulin-like domain-containing nogo receptor-interacting protein 1 [Paramormyrops kingsleyae]XP_023657227.1 leucine-rich repeat and immunoglobulin-like domain-containing nogo receptor-inte
MVEEVIFCWGLWTILIQVGLGTSAAELPWSCPKICDCRQEKLQVNCSNKHLTSIPSGFPVYSQSLNLSHNNLRILGPRQLSNLTQLLELDLSYNNISMIDVEAFQGLQNLRILCLKHNLLKIIPVGVFTGLTSLYLLDVSDNEILVFLDDSFRELVNLHVLEIGVNDLVFISHRAFAGIQNLQDLNVGRCNLTSIPTEALSQLLSLTRLRFHRLSISMLPSNSFRQLNRLRSLEISNWPVLDTLASSSLIGLNLTSLTISKCNLTVVPYTALHHLAYLRYLDLSYNPITTVHRNLLSDLLRLQEFHLAGGHLLQIELGAFKGLVRFNLLNVSSNRLSTLEEGVFHSTGNLRILRLDGNPLACDCRLLWVMRWRQHLDFDGHQPSCSSPGIAQERELRDFRDTEVTRFFTCRKSRIIDLRPQEIKVKEGNSVTIHCKADGDPPPSIFWMTSKRTPLLSKGRIRVLTNGTLEVQFAQVQDGGAFLCVASNAAGNDSVFITLRVLGDRFFHNYSEEGWRFANGTSAQVQNRLPFDAKTLVIAMTMGFLSFLSSVAICFLFIFFWSRGKGQIKRNSEIEFVPQRAMGGGGGGDSRLTMKLI